jgi:phage baseplate assembly protein V
MIGDVDKRIARALAGVRQAFRSVIAAADNSGPIQMVQVVGLSGETLPDLEAFQQYGYTSALPAGTMGVVVPIGGKSSHGIVVATEHGSYRLTGLKTGEVAIYTDEGDSIVLARGRVINVTTKTLNINAEDAVNISTKKLTIDASESVDANTPVVNASQDLTVTGLTAANGGMTAKPGAAGGHALAIAGSADVTEDVTIAGKSFLGHKHPGDSGGTTGTPI